MRKFVSILLFMSVFFTMFAAVGHAAAPQPPKLYLNGTEIHSDVEPRIIQGSTLVPLAILSEGLGYEVEWEPVMKKVTVRNDSKEIQLIINESAVLVDGEIVEMNAKPQLINWRTMVPVRFIGELLGLEFVWKPEEREVHMFNKIIEPDPIPEPDPEQVPEEPEQSENPDEAGNEENSDDAQLPDNLEGYISSILWDEELSTFRIFHNGVDKPAKPLLLNSPNRIKFTFANTGLTSDIVSQFVGGQIEQRIEGNDFIHAFRYTLSSHDPIATSIVLEVGEDTGYVLTELEGEMQIALMPSSEVPIESIDPEVPVNPEKIDGVYDIVIDAGHGGKDPGAHSKSMNRSEKEFNLSVALKLKALLEKESSIRVHLTRTDDTFVELVDRISFAEKLKADLFISIHANSFDKSTVSGSETYYERPNSKQLAEVIHKHLLKGTGLNDRGVRKTAFKVIKETTMPAVLIEAGYLSNETDAKSLYTEAVQDRIAVELVKGIKEYLNLK